MAGQGWGLPPKRIRRDQWIADAAVVHAVQLEIFTGVDFIENEWLIACDGEKLDFGSSCGKGRVRMRRLTQVWPAWAALSRGRRLKVGLLVHRVSYNAFVVYNLCVCALACVQAPAK